MPIHSRPLGSMCSMKTWLPGRPSATVYCVQACRRSATARRPRCRPTRRPARRPPARRCSSGCRRRRSFCSPISCFCLAWCCETLRRVALVLDVVLHRLVGRAQALGVVPVAPRAVLEARQPAFGAEPDLAVLAFGQAVDPVVGQAALGVVDGVQLPLRAVLQVAAADAVDARPGGDPDVAVLRLQHVVDEGVAQPFGDVVGLPLLASSRPAATCRRRRCRARCGRRACRRGTRRWTAGRSWCRTACTRRCACRSGPAPPEVPTQTVSPSTNMRLTFLLPTRKCVNFCVGSAPTLPSRCGSAAALAGGDAGGCGRRRRRRLRRGRCVAPPVSPTAAAELVGPGQRRAERDRPRRR